MNEPFRYRFRVRYNECDAQRVVFNARYADYVDLAMTEFMRALGCGYTELLARGLDNQVVRLTLDWRAPARFERKDVWQFCWASDNPESFAVMEKTKMTLFR